MKITYFGHSCFGIESENYHLLFDPFVQYNELAKDINIDEIECDFMLISHGHEDHVADAKYIADKKESLMISNYEVISWFAKNGYEKGHPLNHGGKKAFEFGTVKYVNAVHSSMMPDGTYGGNPGGFVIEMEGKTFYYAGDTALFLDMKLIGEFEKPDFAFLPIGDNFTMGAEDAAIAANYLDCNKIIGMHYDTFPPIEINQEKAVELFKDNGKELLLMNIGTTIEI